MKKELLEEKVREVVKNHIKEALSLEVTQEPKEKEVTDSDDAE